MSDSANHPVPVLRVARPSNHLAALRRFYSDGLGLMVLAEFRDHDGFDGLMVGGPGAPYHLEFTCEHGVVAPRAPSQEMLLVFYLPDEREFKALVDRMRAAGSIEVTSVNPYWQINGVTFEDPDGYRVVLQHAAWTL